MFKHGDCVIYEDAVLSFSGIVREVKDDYIVVGDCKIIKQPNCAEVIETIFVNKLNVKYMLKKSNSILDNE